MAQHLDDGGGKGTLPSMKSRMSIFTLFGRSFRLLSPSEVTIGYFSNSFDLSSGNKSVLCCQWLSRRESSS